MSLPIFIRVKTYIKILSCITCVSLGAHAWDIDFSRRQNDINRNPASVPEAVIEVPMPGFIKDFIVGDSPEGGELVILNTEKGFVPNRIQLTTGAKYTIHVVNVNESEKNISFILDSFAQHFGTFFGKTRTFTIEPSKEGVFTFISPEVSAEGKIVVTKPEEVKRSLASEECEKH